MTWYSRDGYRLLYVPESEGQQKIMSVNVKKHTATVVPLTVRNIFKQITKAGNGDFDRIQNLSTDINGNSIAKLRQHLRTDTDQE